MTDNVKIEPVGYVTSSAVSERYTADLTYMGALYAKQSHSAPIPLYGPDAMDLIKVLEARATQHERDARMWKSNHDEMVQRNAVLRERPDLPVDRLPSIARYEARIKELDALLANERDQQVHEENARLKAWKAEAMKVMEPFSNTVDHDIGDDEADDDTFTPMTNHNSATKITVGNMRAIHRALTGGQKDG